MIHSEDDWSCLPADSVFADSSEDLYSVAFFFLHCSIISTALFQCFSKRLHDICLMWWMSDLPL